MNAACSNSQEVSYSLSQDSVSGVTQIPAPTAWNPGFTHEHEEWIGYVALTLTDNVNLLARSTENATFHKQVTP